MVWKLQKNLQVVSESIFYHWFFIFSFCNFACYSGFFFNLIYPRLFRNQNKGYRDPSDLWSEWSNIEGRESVALAITGKPMQRPSACVACRYSQGIMGWLHLSFWSRLSFCLVGGRLRTTSTANAGRWQWSTMKCLVYCIGCSNGARTALWASKCMFFDPLWKVVAIVLQRWTLLCDALCIASGPIRNT